MKTMEYAVHAPLSVRHAKLHQLVILVLMLIETSTTTAIALLVIMMLVLINVKNVIQVVLPAQTLILVLLVIHVNLEPLKMVSVFVKMDILNSSMKTETNNANHAQKNVKHVLKVQFNALLVMLQLTELKDMIV